MDANEEYWKFVESERHFNTTQAGIRNRAATWLLAAFGAIAVLIKTSENTTSLVPSAVAERDLCNLGILSELYQASNFITEETK